MIGTVGEIHSFTKQNLAIAAQAFVNSEPVIDLTVLRHFSGNLSIPAARTELSGGRSDQFPSGWTVGNVNDSVGCLDDELPLCGEPDVVGAVREIHTCCDDNFRFAANTPVHTKLPVYFTILGHDLPNPPACS